MKKHTILLILFLAVGISSYAKKQKQQQYNVLLIAVDDLNDWVGFLGGHPQSKTPNMNELAEQSIVFENAQCAAPSCNPSRSALMSGYSPMKSGIFSNNDEMRGTEIMKEAIMLPRYFSNNGYTSLVRGKIFHHAEMDPQSWDLISNRKKEPIPISEGNKTDMTPYKDISIKNKLFDSEKGNLYWEATMEPKEETMDYQTALWTAQWLTDKAKIETPQPFFLACGIFRPHLPWVVPAEHFARFDAENIKLPLIKENDLEDTNGNIPSKEYKYALKHGLRKEAIHAYLASMAYADDCVGVVLDALNNSPYKDNTIVVLFGDHGWHLGEKQRYKKFTLWEESARVPFIIKMPGVKPGRSIRPVSLIDLYPTLIDLANLPVKTDLSGQSIAPILKNPNIEWNYPALTTNKINGHTLRTERYRYIKNKYGEELYDHKNDPQEWDNLINNKQYKDLIESFRKQISNL